MKYIFFMTIANDTPLNPFHLTLSWRRPLSYRNQAIDLLCKSIDWFLYDNGFRHERVNFLVLWSTILLLFGSTFHAQSYEIWYVRIRSYSDPHFSCIFPHSDWIRTDTVSLRIQSECRKIRKKCGPD